VKSFHWKEKDITFNKLYIPVRDDRGLLLVEKSTEYESLSSHDMTFVA
jgi:hypothetical protein